MALMEMTADMRAYYKAESRYKWLSDEKVRMQMSHDEGKAEGKTEERIAMVRCMVKENYPLTEIVKITKMSLDEIKRIAAETND